MALWSHTQQFYLAEYGLLNNQIMTEISKLQPHIVANIDGKAHIICIADIRRLANGECYRGDAQEMIRLLANIVKDLSG